MYIYIKHESTILKIQHLQLASVTCPWDCCWDWNMPGRNN